MKRNRSSAAKTIVGENQFNILPDDVVWLIFDQLITIELDKLDVYRIKYGGLYRVCSRWADLITKLPQCTAATETFLVDIRKAIAQGPAVGFNRTCSVNTDLVRLDCPSGNMCHGLRLAIKFSMHTILARLCSQLGADPVALFTVCDMYNVIRTMARSTFFWYKLQDAHLQPYPAKAAQLRFLYMILPDETQRRLIYVPLWELRHKLRHGKAGGAVMKKTSFSMLRFNGHWLVPSGEYTRQYNQSADPFSRNKETTPSRSFYSLGPDEQAAFLAQHDTSIEQNLTDPSKIYRLTGASPKVFAMRLDVTGVQQEEDCRLIHALLMTLRSKLIEKQTETGVFISQYKGRICSFCPIEKEVTLNGKSVADAAQ